MSQENQLSNPEKNLIAMGAAMGGGCRKCADKLYDLALGMKIPEQEVQRAFQWGLDAKDQTAGTLRAKVDELLGTCCTGESGQKTEASAGKTGPAEKLMPLVRIASFVAANSAPDAAKEIKRAKELGVTDDQVRACISIGKMVRKNAQSFSDDEIEENYVGDRGIEEMCCPSSGSAGSSGCSCG